MKASLRSSLAVVALASGCSGAPADPPPPGAPTQETSRTIPEPAGADEAPAPPAPLSAAPSCGNPGSRILLRLGVTHDGRAPSCYRVEDFSVRFAQKPALITQLGPTDEGYCAIDVLVPEKAESGTITVQAGRDVFESTSPFRVPCH